MAWRLANLPARRRLPYLERELDSAVFDLYGLNQSDRDWSMICVLLVWIYSTRGTKATRLNSSLSSLVSGAPILTCHYADSGVGAVPPNISSNLEL